MFIFYRTGFATLQSIYNSRSEKGCLFLCYVVVANNVGFVFDLT